MGPSTSDATIIDVYLALVRRAGADRAELLALGFAPDVLDRALSRLESAAIITRSQGRWHSTPPDVALPRRASELEREAATLRALTTEVSELYWRSRTATNVSGDPTSQLALTTRAEVDSAAETVVAMARRRLIGFRDNSPRTAEFFAKPMATHRERLIGAEARPLLVECTYESSVLTYPNAGEVLLARAEAGETVRIIDRLPFTLLVADTSAALLDFTTYDSSGGGSLLIRERRQVVALAALADTFWALAAPTALGATGLDPQSGYVLSLLAAGATDAAIAAQTGLSLRTIERRVKALLERLGATTRFQAGVQAARRGWI